MRKKKHLRGYGRRRAAAVLVAEDHHVRLAALRQLLRDRVLHRHPAPVSQVETTTTPIEIELLSPKKLPKNVLLSLCVFKCSPKSSGSSKKPAKVSVL